MGRGLSFGRMQDSVPISPAFEMPSRWVHSFTRSASAGLYGSWMYTGSSSCACSARAGVLAACGSGRILTGRGFSHLVAQVSCNAVRRKGVVGRRKKLPDDKKR